MRQFQHVAVLGRLFENVALATDVADQGHHHLFPDGIYGRIRHLGKELLEIVIKHPRLIAKNGQRGIIAHGPNGVALLIDQRQQHELHRLGRIAERLHPR